MEATTQIFLRVQVNDNEDSAIAGEVEVNGYDDARMLIDSFSFSMHAFLQAPGPADPKPLENCNFDHLTVDKVFDRASTRLAGLLKPANGGKHSPLLTEVRITLDQQLVEDGEGFSATSRKAQNAIAVLRLLKARVVDYKLNVSEEKASATAKEVVTFTFQNVQIDYYYKGDMNNKDDRDSSDYKGDKRDLSGKGASDYRDACRTFITEYEPQPEP